MDGRNRLEELVRQMRDDIEKDAAPRVERLTVRQFLAWFGFYRRSRYNLSWMRACLEDNQLLTEPDVEGTWIDDQIQIRLDPQNGDDVAAEHPARGPTIRITAIAAAHRKPDALPPDAISYSGPCLAEDRWTGSPADITRDLNRKGHERRQRSPNMAFRLRSRAQLTRMT